MNKISQNEMLIKGISVDNVMMSPQHEEQSFYEQKSVG
jgi:hypothetical protein